MDSRGDICIRDCRGRWEMEPRNQGAKEEVREAWAGKFEPEHAGSLLGHPGPSLLLLCHCALGGGGAAAEVTPSSNAETSPSTLVQRKGTPPSLSRDSTLQRAVPGVWRLHKPGLQTQPRCTGWSQTVLLLASLSPAQGLDRFPSHPTSPLLELHPLWILRGHMPCAGTWAL